MANLEETVHQAQETYQQAQTALKGFEEKYKEAKQAVLSAQNTFTGVKNIGDKATIDASTRLLKSVQENLQRISDNLIVARSNVEAARMNLENAKRAVNVSKENNQPTQTRPHLSIPMSYGEIDLKKTPQHKEEAPNSSSELSSVKMTRAEYRKKLREK